MIHPLERPALKADCRYTGRHDANGELSSESKTASQESYDRRLPARSLDSSETGNRRSTLPTHRTRRLMLDDNPPENMRDDPRGNASSSPLADPAAAVSRRGFLKLAGASGLAVTAGTLTATGIAAAAAGPDGTPEQV